MTKESDPIREAQGMALEHLRVLTGVLMDTPDELLLSLAELPLVANRAGVSVEDAPQHIKDAAVRFRQIAKLFLDVKKEINKLYPKDAN